MRGRGRRKRGDETPSGADRLFGYLVPMVIAGALFAGLAGFIVLFIFVSEDEGVIKIALLIGAGLGALIGAFVARMSETGEHIENAEYDPADQSLWWSWWWWW